MQKVLASNHESGWIGRRPVVIIQEDVEFGDTVHDAQKVSERHIHPAASVIFAGRDPRAGEHFALTIEPLPLCPAPFDERQ